MTDSYDVAVIGGGIVGLAHAWQAARRKLRVLLLERTLLAQGASVRNFGMIWPIGQPAGELYSLALRSRDLWLELHAQGVVEVEQCGAIHLAHHADEMSVLQEFADRRTHECLLLTPTEVTEKSTLANPEELLGGLLSPTELRVDPRTASSQIAAWLAECHNVACRFETPVIKVDVGRITAADGQNWHADRIIVCSGSDLQTLYPDVLSHSGLQLCKLQMLRTVSQPSAQPGAPHIASGLTLRHYTSFGDCPSLAAVRARIQNDSPELDRYGIHVMASQRPAGDVILGDSHEYGEDITPFDKSEIDDLMLRELQRVIRLKDWTIAERWHGVYAKHPSMPVFETVTDDGVHIVVGTGGAGMTLAFGLADRAWRQWIGDS